MTRKCPQCGNRSGVVDTRETESTVRRIRQCIKCETRWTTWEASLNPENAVRSVLEAMTRIKTAAMLAEHAIETLQRCEATPRINSNRRPHVASKCSPQATGTRADSRGNGRGLGLS